ncbi:MAG: type II toxin-antitoxin system VapC family toxin [Firmicutes bacterium]|nr:type II toxin-antitoxin system VapC family toxin [Bacillota bacterium]
MSLLCLDSSVLVKLVVPEPGSDVAARLLDGDSEVVSPSFAWAEVGSALRKQVRAGVLTKGDAERAWRDFLDLGVRFIDTREIREAAWDLAGRLELLTLYDAAFLAVAKAAPGGPCPFWTADAALAAQVRRSGAPVDVLVIGEKRG